MGMSMTKLTDDFLRTFSMPQVALLHTLALEMETYGLTAADVIDLCVEKLESLRKPKESQKPEAITLKPKKRRKARLSDVRCPECQSFCEITPVNVSKCTRVGGSWKTSLMCSNEHCRFTELSEKTLEEWRNDN